MDYEFINHKDLATRLMNRKKWIESFQMPSAVKCVYEDLSLRGYTNSFGINTTHPILTRLSVEKFSEQLRLSYIIHGHIDNAGNYVPIGSVKDLISLDNVIAQVKQLDAPELEKSFLNEEDVQQDSEEVDLEVEDVENIESEKGNRRGRRPKMI